MSQVCVSAECVFIQLLRKIEVGGSLPESIAYRIVAVYYFSASVIIRSLDQERREKERVREYTYNLFSLCAENIHRRGCKLFLPYLFKFINTAVRI